MLIIFPEVFDREKIDTVISAVTGVQRICNVSVEMLTRKPDGDVLKVEKDDLVNAKKDDDIIDPVYRAVMKGCRPMKNG